MAIFNLFVGSFVLAAGVFLMNQRKTRLNRILAVIGMAFGGYLVIGSLVSIFYWVKAI